MYLYIRIILYTYYNRYVQIIYVVELFIHLKTIGTKIRCYKKYIIIGNA